MFIHINECLMFDKDLPYTCSILSQDVKFKKVDGSLGFTGVALRTRFLNQLLILVE